LEPTRELANPFSAQVERSPEAGVADSNLGVKKVALARAVEL
jgi:hypothetical protein